MLAVRFPHFGLTKLNCPSRQVSRSFPTLLQSALDATIVPSQNPQYQLMIRWWLLPLRLWLFLVSLGRGVGGLLLFRAGRESWSSFAASSPGSHPTRTSRGTAPPLRPSIPRQRREALFGGSLHTTIDAPAGFLPAPNGGADDARSRRFTKMQVPGPTDSVLRDNNNKCGAWSFPPWKEKQFDTGGSILVPHYLAESPTGPTAVPRATQSLWRPLLVLRGAGTDSADGSPNLVDYKLEWTVPPPPPVGPDGNNGADRFFGIDNDRERLSDLLRRHGTEQRTLAPQFSKAQIRELTTSMHAFEAWIHQSAPYYYCSSSNTTTTSPSVPFVPSVSTIRARLRLVASRGPAATKCPRFHIDHVPFRWIQSLVGPGCDVVMDPSTVHWPILLRRDDSDGDNDNDDDDHDERWTAQEWNRRLLLPDARPEAVQRVPEGQPVILLGSRWQEWTLRFGTRETAATLVDLTAGMSSSTTVPLPVLHKSPSLPLPWHGRVLLTLDLVTDNLLL